MFTNQISNFPNFGRQGIPAARPLLTNPLPDLYPEGAETPQGWGLTMMLSNLEGGASGRGQGTGHWAGLANLFWWCDRVKGAAGMVASQILPFGGESMKFSRNHPGFPRFLSLIVLPFETFHDQDAVD